MIWQPDKGAAVPKFGDWDENNPSSADGYTHIFNKVREERQTGATARVPGPATDPNYPANPKPGSKVYIVRFPCLIQLITTSYIYIYIYIYTQMFLFSNLFFSRYAAFHGGENEVYEMCG